ncbi:MAG: hypothetical protein L6435_02975, partial [Anaerolineae bacterium]|nr:hypothetical protein [Anaerolineae bacterium]
MKTLNDQSWLHPLPRQAHAGSPAEPVIQRTGRGSGPPLAVTPGLPLVQPYRLFAFLPPPN